MVARNRAVIRDRASLMELERATIAEMEDQLDDLEHQQANKGRGNASDVCCMIYAASSLVCGACSCYSDSLLWSSVSFGLAWVFAVLCGITVRLEKGAR